MVSIPQAVWIACNEEARSFGHFIVTFQYRKRYGLHAIGLFLSCSKAQDLFQYRKRYGLHAISNLCRKRNSCFVSIPQAVWIACNSTKNNVKFSRLSFNTASGMDCMQYRPSQPLGQLNPEAGFLNGSLFWTNRRNLAGFFCRQNRLKTSANPVISRKLLSTGKI